MARLAARFRWQVVTSPLAGVKETTDAHLVAETRAGLVIALVDGHGQGSTAASASRAALGVVRGGLADDPATLFPRVHGRVADSQGVSLAHARISSSTERIEFRGIGRIRGLVATDSRLIELVSDPGVLGVGRPVAPSPIRLPWHSESLLVLASDGLVDCWDLSDLGPLVGAEPAEIVDHLVRPFGRPPDDVTLIVVKGI